MGNYRKHRRKIVAWLITWEWIGDHAKVENKIVAILNYRRSGEYVRKITELLYANNCFSLRERVAYARNKRNNPYPAQIYSGERIHCGHNPYLYARLVDDLCVNIDENGEESITWKDRPIPKHIQEMLKDARSIP